MSFLFRNCFKSKRKKKKKDQTKVNDATRISESGTNRQPSFFPDKDDEKNEKIQSPKKIVKLCQIVQENDHDNKTQSLPEKIMDPAFDTSKRNDDDPTVCESFAPTILGSIQSFWTNTIHKDTAKRRGTKNHLSGICRTNQAKPTQLNLDKSCQTKVDRIDNTTDAYHIDFKNKSQFQSNNNEQLATPVVANDNSRQLRTETTKNQEIRIIEKHDQLTIDGKQNNQKKCVINGDIVVCASYNSNVTSDTAIVSSLSSSSNKAQSLQRDIERNARAASSLDEKGNELFEMGYFEKAMACYTKALKLKRRTFNHLLEEVDDMEDQLVQHKNSNTDPKILVSMATSINNIGYLRQRSGVASPEETMAAYKKSLGIKRRILGNDSLSVGKTLNNIGSVHYLKRDLDLALPAYEEALEIMKANLGGNHQDVATVMSNIGDVYLAKGIQETSLQYYRLALTIRWDKFGEKSPRVVRLLEKISNLEIGDRMLSSRFRTNGSQHNWDDGETRSEALQSECHPIGEELKRLQDQITQDIDQLNQMERKATVEMLKDKIVIIRGMRNTWNGNGVELLDNDSESVITAMSRRSRGGRRKSSMT